MTENPEVLRLAERLAARPAAIPLHSIGALSGLRGFDPAVVARHGESP
jgi:hypothetical protein